MKIKVGVFFGGNSVEHEISVITMNQAISSLDPEKYEIVPIYIAKNGVMYTGDDLLDLYSFRDMEVLLKRCYQVAVVNDGKGVKVMRCPAPWIGKRVLNTIDVAFPIVHGTNCEDGTIAGFVTLLGIPFVGPDILASSIGMDKILQKKILRQSGISVVDFVPFYSVEYIKDEEKILKEIEEKLEYPVIVKPGNLGSSVGIRKAKNKVELEEAIEFAMEFADRIIVEKAVENLKEINCSVIGNLTETEASICEEPFFSDEILSYTDKYIGDGKTKGGTIGGGKAGSAKLGGQKGGAKGGNTQFANKKIPADISKEKTEEIQKLAQEVFKVLGCSGVSRIDFLIDTKTDKVYVNEINTIPGALSYYLWEATGKSFEKELDEIIEIAIKRHRDKEKLTFSYDQNILAMQGGAKGAKGGKTGKI
ncbi:MAG: D-alanine--D-alanine ligase [Clostridia bacterium]|nr:D-alanine--D-alanine ligase [Clostridia bacterium]